MERDNRYTEEERLQFAVLSVLADSADEMASEKGLRSEERDAWLKVAEALRAMVECDTYLSFLMARGRRDWRKWERRSVRVRMFRSDGEWEARVVSRNNGPYQHDGPSKGEALWRLRAKWRMGVCKWTVNGEVRHG